MAINFGAFAGAVGKSALDTYTRLNAEAREARKAGREEEAYEKIKELVVDILNLDKSKNVDIKYLDEHFDDVRVLKLIVECMMNHVKEIAQDPNFKTPGSTKKK